MGTRWSSLWALLLVLSGNMLIDALEVSTVVVALPAIGRAFALTPAQASLAMTAFAVGFGGSIILGGRLTARYGRRRVYLLAMLAFAVASVASGLATSASLLFVTRVVKGVCVALTAPTGLAIIANAFPPGPSRDRATSTYALCGASGFSVGLLVSGALTPLSWRWPLVASGPAAFALFLLGLRLVPRESAPAPSAPGPARDGATPARPLRGNRALWRSAVGGAVLNGSFWGFLLVVTFQAQAGQRWSPLATGLVLLPASLPLVVSSLRGHHLVRRWGPARLIVAGNVAALAAYTWYAFAWGHGLLARLVPAVLLVGVAFVLAFAALNVQAMGSSPPGRQQLVGGVFQTAVQLGGAAMLVVVAFVAGAQQRSAVVVIASVAAVGLLVALGGLATAAPSREENRVHQSS